MTTPSSNGHDPVFSGSALPTGAQPFRVAVGLGDPQLEQRVVPMLREPGDLVIAARCLAADQLLRFVRRELVDAILVSDDLHRLAGATLAELAQERTALIVLVTPGGEGRWQGLPVTLLPRDSDPEAIREALLLAARGERYLPQLVQGWPPTIPADRGPLDDRPAQTTVVDPTEATSPEFVSRPDAELAVLVVASGPGSPGRTTVALSLATALGAAVPTVLVEADLTGPSLAALLDLDPTRNLAMLAHAAPETPHEWELALEQELQALDVRSPFGRVLGGIPKPELRGSVSPRFFEELLGELRRSFRYVVLDVGADLAGSESALHRAALAQADQVLLVASADLSGLWRAQGALRELKARLELPPERVALVVNQHDRRYHQARQEIEWALGVATAAIVPFDHEGAERARSVQRPLVLDRKSPAARALLDLAERAYGGSVKLPPEPGRKPRLSWLRRPKTPSLRWPDLGRLVRAQVGAAKGRVHR